MKIVRMNSKSDDRMESLQLLVDCSRALETVLKAAAM